jgi:hypothetical protein
MMTQSEKWILRFLFLIAMIVVMLDVLVWRP